MSTIILGNLTTKSGLNASGNDLHLKSTNSMGTGTASKIAFFASQRGTTSSSENSFDPQKVLEFSNSTENDTSTARAKLDLFYGTKSVSIQPSTSTGSSYSLTLPADDGDNGEVLTTNGSGVLTWGSASGITINNNSDTSILTATGSATSLDAESKLKFNATSRSLIIGDGSDESSTIKLGGSSGNESISTAGDSAGIKLSSSTNAANAVHLHASEGAAQTIKLENVAGTGNAAIDLTATAGGITAKVADEKELTLGNTDGDAYFKVAASSTAGNEDVRIVNTYGTDEAAIAITASAGGVDIDAASSKDVNVAGGQVALVSKDNATSAISLTANVGTSETIVVTNTQGTAAGAIALTATAGGITATVADEKDLTLGNAGGDAYFKVAASATAGNEDVRVVNTNGTDEAAIAITATAGGVDIDAAAAKDVNIAGGQVALVSKDNATSAISLTANVGTAETIEITNTQGTSATAISLTATAGGIDINAGSAGIDIQTAGVLSIDSTATGAAANLTHAGAAGQDLTVSCTNGSLNLTGGEADAAAVKIQATNNLGGIDIDALAGGIDILTNGPLSIDSASTETSANLTHVGAAGNDLIVSCTAGSLNLTSGEVNAVDAVKIEATHDGGGIDIDAGTGGIDILTTGVFSIDSSATNAASNLSHVGAAGNDLTVSCTSGSLNLTGGEANALDAVKIEATHDGGGIDIDAGTGGIAINSTGSVGITGSSVTLYSSSNGNINLTPDGSGLVSIDGVNFFEGNQNSSANSLYIGKASHPSGAANQNLSIGVNASLNLSTGDNNVTVGYNAGKTINTGSNNTLIGVAAGNSISSGNNNIVLGYDATASAATANNEVTLGNSSVSTLRCGTNTITSISDQRDKTNILDINYGVDFLNMLRPVEFEWQMRELTESDKNCAKNGTKQVGFLAQELQAAMTGNQNETLNLVFESNPERLEIRQGHLIPILVKAVQELKAEIDALKAANNSN